MTIEKYGTRTRKTELSVTNNAVSAILKSDTAKTGLRVYDNGNIGVAGAIGSYDENRLLGRAKHMLNFAIPYDCEPASDACRHVDLTGAFKISDEDFVRISEELLDKLSRNYPQFSFNHKIVLEENEVFLINDKNAGMSCRDKNAQVELLIKHKGSKNLMDSIGATVMRGFDLESMYGPVSETCACYEEKVEAPESKMPVVMLFNCGIILQKFYTDLNGRSMGTNASLFSGKIGQKLFSDNFTLQLERYPLENYQCFFDAEGTVLPGDRFPLIENGVLKHPYSSKKIAKQYGFPATGSAGGDYDSVPDTSPESIAVKSSGKTINELLGGREAIYIVFASGGDFTSQGEYASPVQSSFLFRDGRLIGRLPQLSISSNVYGMFGKDFIGLSTDGNNPLSPMKYLAIDMNVTRIGDWF